MDKERQLSAADQTINVYYTEDLKMSSLDREVCGPAHAVKHTNGLLPRFANFTKHEMAILWLQVWEYWDSSI